MKKNIGMCHKDNLKHQIDKFQKTVSEMRKPKSSIIEGDILNEETDSIKIQKILFAMLSPEKVGLFKQNFETEINAFKDKEAAAGNIVVSMNTL